MTAHLLPICFALFVWWASTIGILYVDGLPQRTYKWSMAVASGVLVLALWGLAATRNDQSVAGAYCAFSCAILVWAWQELAFLLGYVTGPRRMACPAGTRGWQRLKLACLTIAHHELALLLLFAAVLAVTWGGANAIALWSYVILWVMRLSAKLNVFLGVRNLNGDFLPAHLKYLESYFRKRPMNPLLPLSVIAASWVAAGLWGASLSADATPFDVTLLALCATLLTLAVLEHVLMVLPLPTDALWAWGMKSHLKSQPIAPPVRGGGAAP